MSRYFNTKYADLKPYVPGEQPGKKKYIKLNTNESPYAPSESVIKALTDPQAVKNLRLYEDPNNEELNHALAKHFHVKRENVLSAGGSDEVLDLAFTAYGEDGIAYPDLSYGFYTVFADYHHIPVQKIPVKEDFTIDIHDYFDLNKAIVIANPNAPTGLFLKPESICEILEHNRDHVVIIDEAYIDFGGTSMVPYIEKYPNLLVVQTFSKSHSLAGARIGMAAGDAALIQDLETLRNSRNPYDISRLSQTAAILSLKDQSYYDDCSHKIMKTREWTEKQLKELGFVFNPSMTNFVFAKYPGISGKKIKDELKSKGILVRWFEGKRTEDYVRITIGTNEDMQALLNALKEIIDECKNS